MFQPISSNNPVLSELSRELVMPAVAEEKSGQTSARVATSYSGEEIQDFRKALRLAAKLNRAIDKNPQDEIEIYYYHDEGLSRTSHSAEAQLLLTLTRQNRDVVVAGALFNAFEGFSGADLNRRKSAIRKKFGERVVRLIELSDECRASKSPFNCEARFGSLRNKLQFEGRIDLLADAATLAAAAMVAERRAIGGKELTIMVAGANVPAQVMYELIKQSPGIVKHDCVGAIREQLELEGDAQAYSTLQINTIRRAAQLSLEIFRNAMRAWGKYEELPLSVHDFEVGLMLAAAGSNADTIEAGLLHDGLEEYVGTPLERVHELIANCSSARTLELINLQTEPPKRLTQDCFWSRKGPVVRALLSGDRDLAELMVAAKTSTLSFGNKHLLVTHSINGWSQGSFIDNLDLYQLYHSAGCKVGVSKPLLDALQAEINQFAALGERFDLLHSAQQNDNSASV